MLAPFQRKMAGKVSLASGLISSIPFSESGTLPLKADKVGESTTQARRIAERLEE